MMYIMWILPFCPVLCETAEGRAFEPFAEFIYYCCCYTQVIPARMSGPTHARNTTPDVFSPPKRSDAEKTTTRTAAERNPVLGLQVVAKFRLKNYLPSLF